MATSKKHVSAAEWRMVGLLNVCMLAVFILTVIYGFILLHSHATHNAELHNVAENVHLVLGLVFIGLACVHVWVNKWWYSRWGRGLQHSLWQWCKRVFGLLFATVFAIVAVTALGIWLFHWHVVPMHYILGLVFLGLAVVHIVTNLRGLWTGIKATI